MKKQNEGGPISTLKLPSRFRNTNAMDYLTTNEPYQVFPEGIMVCKIKLSQNIDYDKREKFLYSIGLTSLSLNEDLDYNTLFNYLFSINNNKKIIAIPVKPNILNKIISRIFKTRDGEGELIPQPNHLRKIIFNDKLYNFTKEEKIKIINQQIGFMKKEKTKEIIYNAIEGWNKDEKITAIKIAEEVSLSLRTVKTYWPEFKSYVKTLNENIKKESSINVDQDNWINEIYENKMSKLNSKLNDENDIELSKEELLDFLNLDVKQNNIKFIKRLEIQPKIENGSIKTINQIIEF